MGKSALLREFVRLESAQTQSAWVVLGQWHGEEFGGSALIEAANDLIYRILGAHENEIAYWASIFRKELGDALPLLRRQIPALSLIVGAAGEQGELPEEGKTIEAIGLLSRAIGSLFHVVCSHCDGLVLVLDDLHYAPRWELEVLKNILTLEATKPMLVLSSYRPEEIDASSSLLRSSPKYQRMCVFPPCFCTASKRRPSESGFPRASDRLPIRTCLRLKFLPNAFRVIQCI